MKSIAIAFLIRIIFQCLFYQQDAQKNIEILIDIILYYT